MEKFKKGDRVRFKNLNQRDYPIYVKDGSTGTVMEDDSTVPYVRWDSEEMVIASFMKDEKTVTAEDEDYLELIELENQE